MSAPPISPRTEPSLSKPVKEVTPRAAFSDPLANEALELLVGLAEDVRVLKQQFKDLDATTNRHAMHLQAHDDLQTEIRQQLRRLEEGSQLMLAEQARRLEETRRVNDDAEALRQQAAALAEAAASRAVQPRYRLQAAMPLEDEELPEASDRMQPHAVSISPTELPPAAPVDGRQAEYRQAIALAANGVTVQELMAQCGLSRPEAQLIVLLHGRGGQV